MQPNPLIHIGYHKTGSSFLQFHVFDNKALGFKTVLSSEKVKEAFIYPHPYAFDAQATQAALYPEIRAIADSKLLPVITREGLSGQLFYGGLDSLESLRRLHAVLPVARILIVIREQDSMLLSTYNQFVRRGGCESLETFLKDREDMVRFNPIQFAYHHLIGAYQQHYGRDSVQVLPFELFLKTPADYIARILTFAGVEPNAEAIAALPFGKRVNPAMPTTMMTIRRWLNHIAAHPNVTNPYPLIRYSKRSSKRINSAFNKIGSRFPATWNDTMKQRQKRVIREYMGDYYADSNAQTAALTGLDLAGYGYRLPV